MPKVEMNDDDLFVSPRILEQRRTGIVHPLGLAGLCLIASEAPIKLAAMGIEVTPDSIAEQVRAQLERGVGQGVYKWPDAADFEAAMSDDLLEEVCLAFERQYGNGSDFVDAISKTERAALLRSSSEHMFEVVVDRRPDVRSRFN